MSEDTWERAEWQESCVSDSVTSVAHSPTHLRWWIHREAMCAHRLVPFSVLSSCCNKPFPLCDKQDKRNQGIVQRRICCESVILSWWEREQRRRRAGALKMRRPMATPRLRLQSFSRKSEHFLLPLYSPLFYFLPVLAVVKLALVLPVGLYHCANFWMALGSVQPM